MTDYTLTKEVNNILGKFKKAGFQIYIVGGAVRDLLMGKPVHDWDFTTNAKPEEILKLYSDGFYDNKFGTVGIPVGKDIFEITTMRKEGLYKDSRHPVEVSWTNKIDDDLARRDFTINAIALSDKEIVDPYKGQEDLKNKIVKTVGEPFMRFQEDALRLIRAIRIATQLNFEIEKETKNAISKNVDLIKNIASERIRDELFKILSSDNAYKGMILLREVGILQIILPELDKCFGIVQEGPKHDRVYDIGEHCLLALKFTPSNDPLVRLAAFLHDVGKAPTVRKGNDGNVTFFGHEVAGGKIVLEISKRFNLSKKQTEKLYLLVRWHMFSVSEDQTDSAIRRFIKNVGVENIEDMMAIRVGDRLGGGTQTETSWRIEKFKERIKEVLKKPFSISDLKLNGNDVMKELNLKPGKKVGEILQKLFEEVLEDSSKNNKGYLLNRIKNLE